MKRGARGLTLWLVCMTVNPWQSARAEGTPRPPTPAQAQLCRLEIDTVRQDKACEGAGSDAQVIAACSPSKKKEKCAPCDVLLRCLESVSDNPNPRKYGAWQQVIPEDNGAAIGGSLGMATIHAVLLPSGKILLAGGSCWRNPLGTATYPDEEHPELGEGLFFRHGAACRRAVDDPFLNNRRTQYHRLVNNVAVYDPEDNTFFRVPPPPLKDNGSHAFHANDLFCSGHLHLPDGNPLFMGGTQYYSPVISGVRTSYIFDWKEELKTPWVDVDWRQRKPVTSPWIFSGLMQQGRWYPTPVPLLDGRMVILSGLRGFDEPGDVGRPYLFEVNHLVELFDPEKFNRNEPQAAWTSIDVKELPNSPFQQELKTEVGHGICQDGKDLQTQGIESLPCHPEGEEAERSERDFKYDAFKLYPHVYNFGRDAAGREQLFFTREGDYISMRSPDMATMRNVRRTYWMNIEGQRDDPRISFDPGPLRTDVVPSFGTSFVDPNNGAIRVLGGGKNSPGTIFPLSQDWTQRNRFVGARGSRDMETFRWSDDEPRTGSWSRTKDFLGRHPQDDRILSSAVLLPTKQVLVINGGNYQLQKPTFHPLLLTPQDGNQEQADYEVERMSEAVQPRQYHAVALLLPDGRVWTSGGNSAPAMVNTHQADWQAWETEHPKPLGAQPKHNPDFVDLNPYFFREGRYARREKGSFAPPTENWTAEIFSPPYLFIDDDRRAELVDIQDKKNDDPVGFTVPGATADTKVYLLKSGREYLTTITGAPTVNGVETTAGHYRLIKLPSVTHAADFGQRLYELDSLPGGAGFRTPQALSANIPPGYYMLFFVDALGKPAHAKMVRFDDSATSP